MFASSENASTDLANLIRGYALCALSEGKSRNYIALVTNSVRYLEQFLRSHHQSTDARGIGPMEIRAFILYLKQAPCLASHPFAPPQDRGLSGHTVNSYLRSIRAFWSWLVAEEIIDRNPFDRVKIPKPPNKVIPTFSDSQLQALLQAINTGTSEGYRDMAIILTLLDTGLRISELLTLKMQDAHLEEGVLKVLGKGNKERVVPIGRQIQRLLWRYTSLHRPSPDHVNADLLFLTRDGTPMSVGQVQIRMARYGRRAGLGGVRCSPHTLRHTAAVRFLRNGGDAFSLQRLLGHSCLEMTRRYCQLADVDVERAHRTASPVDNLGFGTSTFGSRIQRVKSWGPRRK